MKYLISLLIIAFLIGCESDPKKKFEAFSAEAFAYDIGDGYEVNAVTRVAGFTQEENSNKEFSSSLQFHVDLVIPNGDTMRSVYTNILERKESEAVVDIPLEAQFELDSSFNYGNYKVIFNIKDKKADETAVSSAEFIIEKPDSLN